MSEKLNEITSKVINELATDFNTILLNECKDGNDCIGFHRDRGICWARGLGSATLGFGA